MLKEVVRRLTTCIRDCDTASRYGGDKFVIVLTEIWGEGNATPVANKVLEAIMQPIQIGQESVQISTSIGIAIFPDNGSIAETLIKEADKAMYAAKQNGAGQFSLSNPDSTFEHLADEAEPDESHAFQHGLNTQLTKASATP